MTEHRSAGHGFNLNTLFIAVSLVAILWGGAWEGGRIIFAVGQKAAVLEGRLDDMGRQLVALRAAAADDRAASKDAISGLIRKQDLLGFEVGEIRLVLARAGLDPGRRRQ
jgi:hypothetical protein